MTRYCELCGVSAPGERIIDGAYLCEKCIVRETAKLLEAD